MWSNSFRKILVIAGAFLLVSAAFPVARPEPRTSSGGKQKNSLEVNHQGEHQETSKSENELLDNEIDDRIDVPQHYKTIAVTLTRYILPQTPIPKYLQQETAVSLLSDVGRMLTRRKTLARFIKVMTVLTATLLTATFLWPGAIRFMDEVWQEPMRVFRLDKHLTNGVGKMSVLELLGSRTDEALRSFGLQDTSRRERSLCYTGEWIRCTFPVASDHLIKWGSDFFSFETMKDNKYVRAFTDGFVDQKCQRNITENVSYQECFGNLVNSVLNVSPTRNHDQRPQQQELKARSTKDY